MRLIYKYMLDRHMYIDMPESATILSAQEQHGSVVLWAEVDPKADLERVHFDVITTGTEMSEIVDRAFIDTVQLQGGAIILHIYRLN